MLAMPTQAHKLQQVFKTRQEEAKEEKKEALLTKYGGKEHLEVPDVILRAETEEYVEYSRDGRVLKGRERQMVQSKCAELTRIEKNSALSRPLSDWCYSLPSDLSSENENSRRVRVLHVCTASRADRSGARYMEDIHPGNHSSVWGSWFCIKTLSWGYKCCNQTHRQAYPQGAAGRVHGVFYNGILILSSVHGVLWYSRFAGYD